MVICINQRELKYVFMRQDYVKVMNDRQASLFISFLSNKYQLNFFIFMKLEEWTCQISVLVGKQFCFLKNCTVTYIDYSFQYERSDTLGYKFYKCIPSLHLSIVTDTWEHIYKYLLSVVHFQVFSKIIGRQCYRLNGIGTKTKLLKLS